LKLSNWLFTNLALLNAEVASNAAAGDLKRLSENGFVFTPTMKSF
jgi:hypothetical protein